MPASPSRAPLFLGTAVVLLVATGVSVAGVAHLRERLKGEAREALVQATGVARVGLEDRQRALEGRVVSATQLNPVRALAASRADRATLEDGLVNEPWWAVHRKDFPVYALVLDDAAHFEHGATLEALAALVEQARTAGVASVTLPLEGTPTLLAAAPVSVPRPGGAASAVLVLGRPVVAEDLKAVVRPPVTAVWLGAPGATEGLREGPAQALPASGLTRDGLAAFEKNLLAPGLELRVAADLEPSRERHRLSLLGLLAPTWTLALLFAVTLLLVARRRGRPGALAEAQEQLAEARAQLERASRRYDVPEEVQQLPQLASATDTEPTPGAPVQFGRFQLLSMLGEGGMARVYLAVARGTNGFERRLVVKRLRPELCRTPELVQHFIDEARLGASLVHSNVVPVFDFGQVGSEYFIAQEYIAGRDLDTLVRRAVLQEQRPLDVPLALYVLGEALKALNYAHTRAGVDGRPLGIVHRDISPMNLMVSVRGEVKLLDFGIAKSELRSDQTRVGVVKGNALFMAPEQARGQATDARSDLFSLALTTYWCLTGETLYRASSDYDRLVRAASGLGQREWGAVQSLPEPARALLERALQLEPADRFQSAEEFYQALPQPLLEGAAARLRELMTRLFAEELRREEAGQRVRAEPPAEPKASEGGAA